MTRRRGVNRKPYRGEHYWELLWGPAPWKADALTEAELLELWANGGREYVMRFPDHWKPGFRPWAWWIADYPDELKRKAERAKNPPDVMTLLHWSGDARPGEREAWLIWRRDELERECKWLEYLEAKLVKPENAGKRATLEQWCDEAARKIARLSQ